MGHGFNNAAFPIKRCLTQYWVATWVNDLTQSNALAKLFVKHGGLSPLQSGAGQVSKLPRPFSSKLTFKHIH